MNWLNKARDALRRWMIGRNGADELSMALLIFGVIMAMVSSFTRWAIFDLVGLAAYVYSFWRMFSKNLPARASENHRWQVFTRRTLGSVRQFFNRLKNMGKYKYVRCPQCHTRTRQPRHRGELTVTCGQCHHVFKQKT